MFGTPRGPINNENTQKKKLKFLGQKKKLGFWRGRRKEGECTTKIRQLRGEISKSTST